MTLKNYIADGIEVKFAFDLCPQYEDKRNDTPLP
jgi:hypothetical protein